MLVLLFASLFGYSVANPGVVAGISGDFLNQVLEFTVPGVLLMVLDKNWGDVEVQIDKDTIEYIQLKNITIGGTTFDGFGSKLGVAEPSDVNLNIKGFNSTVDMGFYVKLWLGDLHGTVSLDITDASLDVSTEWSNVAGAP